MLSRADIRDLGVLVALSSALGLASLGIRGDELPLVAPPPDPSATVCGLDELGAAAVQRISVAGAIELLDRDDVTFVDARSTDLYREGHVPRAFNLPSSDAASALEVQSLPIPPENLVITYCDGLSCEQSEYLGLLLQERAACENVSVLEGGWHAWVEAGAPVATGSPGDG